MTTKQVLVKARALIKQGWTQGTFARRKDGHHTEPTSRDAAKFCMSGALTSAGAKAGMFDPAYLALAEAIGLSSTGMMICHWNDLPGRTKAEVVSAFDRAIKACK